ncbi:hypothetical protein MCOR27_003767 [Pyricularia oryzae]|uniref:Uncharacterized protein n=2 Tax=Pyricularia TaxID=48558 RepID=A0ABQ8NE31_PYRGI|nr:hypothetical protein MCOR19_010264 [Pyricularia oryzae]KAI6295542.1 hypothetical protein MCOR33_007561 [Pyricularia grisea]KAI6282364.1 hypothetical protein MCOR27_003767 [Pyricularia oryzae]KAI6284869.1 hypothetical protein MCOR26_001765 [Pyricularia oryzae]KAI6314601.1 hypothetical protein MCOR34_004888 [Pyricularia oryzae]
MLGERHPYTGFQSKDDGEDLEGNPLDGEAFRATYAWADWDCKDPSGRHFLTHQIIAS